MTTNELELVPPPDQNQPPRRNIGVWALLLFILLLAGYFRFSGLNWDAYTHLHPDERFLTIVTSKLERPGSFLSYIRTSESPLNPYNKNESFYVYGNFPMTATFYAGQWATQLQSLCAEGSEQIWCGNALTGYDGVHFVGRFLSGFLDLIAVFFTFLIGRRLYGNSVGLLASFFMATAVMPIQQSHFYTMDNWAAAFATIAIYIAILASQNAIRLRWWVLFGFFLGLTVASRINVAPLALIAGIAGLAWLAGRYQRWITNRLQSDNTDGLPQAQGGRILHFALSDGGWLDLQTVAMAGITAATVSLIVFRLAQPYAFADAQIVRDAVLQQTGAEPGFLRTAIQSIVGLNPQWLGNMEEIQRLQAPEASFPPALQWTDRTAILFPLTNMLLYGMGPLAGLLAWIGFMVALWQIVRAKPGWTLHLIPVTWAGGYFLFSATRWVKSIRYFLPIYPVLFVLAAWLIITWWRSVDRDHRLTAAKMAVGGVGVLAVLSSVAWASAFTEIYRQPMTRVAASEWIYENVPTAATFFYEVDGEVKQMQLPLRLADLSEGAPPYAMRLKVPEDALTVAVKFNYAVDSESDNLDDTETINVRILAPGGQSPLIATSLGVNLDNERRSIQVDLPPVTLRAGTDYSFFVEAGSGGPFRLETSILSSEHWDDALPSRLGGRDPFSQYYQGISAGQMATTHPDSDQKRLELNDWIRDADYIVLSSQRSLWSLPRLPLTYPLMITYYEALFSGELGFDLVAEFHGDIHVGPLYISDTAGKLGWGNQPQIGWPPPGNWAAEEAFSVYDHPPVWIFKKTDRFSEARLQAIFGRVDLSQVVVMNPLEATNAPNGLMLTNEQQAVQQQGGTFRELFNPDGWLNQSEIAATAIWWLTIILLGWVAFPITFIVFRGLSDRGYAVSRILSILLLAYFSWLLASWGWLPFTSSTIALGLLILSIGSALIFTVHSAEIMGFVRSHWRLLLITELWALALFLLQIGIRLGNPDAWHVIWGGEKPMDMSYFTAVLKSTTFPPYDPWLAGGFINYYYYGFVYVGIPTKLLGIVPATAYNLILPMLFSMAGTGAFSLAYSLVRRSQNHDRSATQIWGLPARPVAAGVAATVFALLLGNLREVGVMLGAWLRASTLDAERNILVRTLQGGWRILSGQTPAPIYPGDWFWTATRAIGIEEGEVAPITEFPFFTFLYGDLHAHMIALPLTILALGWALSLALTPTERTYRPGGQWLSWLIGGLAIGVLYPVNSWDYPTYVVIGILAIIFYFWQRDGWSLPSLGQMGVLSIAIVAISLLAYWPFWSNFGTGYATMRLWEGSFTSVGDYLAIHGLFLLIIITYLFADLRTWAQSLTVANLADGSRWLSWGLVVAFALLPILFWGLVMGYQVLPLALTLVLFSGLLSLRRNSSPERRIVNALISSAIALTLFVEIFVLDGDIGRMNTVFKFYMQVWVIFSIVSAAALLWLWPRINGQWGEIGRWAWQMTFATLVAAALLYPLLATRAKWTIRENADIAPVTLDGMAYMEYVSYGDSGQTITLQEDYEAIQWMYRNIEGSPVILEAHSGNPYRSAANRVSMYTGLPSVVGWDWHQRQQRNTVPGSIVSRRIQHVNEIYSTNDQVRAFELLQQYDVDYVYAGQLEIAYYGLNGVLKFEEMAADGYLTEVYRNRGVSIYRVAEREMTTN